MKAVACIYITLGTALTGLDASAPSADAWKPVKLTYYGSYYDKGKHKTADGTIYSRDALLCAAWQPSGSHAVLPLGTVIEIRYKDKIKRLVVRDRQASKSNRRIDLPDGVWLSFGEPASKGVLSAEWRLASEK